MSIQRGEVIRVYLNPTSGREQQGEARPCLVISHTSYNQARNGMVVVMPITSTVRPEIKTMIQVPFESGVEGSVIAEQIRTLDLSNRWWKTTGEVLPQEFVDQVVSTFYLIIGSLR
ncbi:MAG: type II toxin-antitoxin system PemK/MazF family toxin [Cyanobacteria bacterium J06639_14]